MKMRSCEIAKLRRFGDAAEKVEVGRVTSGNIYYNGNNAEHGNKTTYNEI